MDEGDLPVAIGDAVTLSKTLTESDIALFTAVSGDFDPIHLDDRYARGTPFARRIAHGLLTAALLSGAGSLMSAKARERGFAGTPLSLGYDRMRFVHPVFIGDTLTATYTVEALDREKRRSTARAEVVNHDAVTCVVAQHLMIWRAP